MKNVLLCFVLILFSFVHLCGQTTIAKQGFEDSGDTWSYSPSPVFGTFTMAGDDWQIEDNSYLNLPGMPTEGAKFVAGQDIENPDNPNGNFVLLNFSNVDISAFNSVTLSFDYQVVGYDNGDDVFYTIQIDNIVQPEVKLIDGSSNLNTSGTETINIPDGSNAVSVVLRIEQNGGDLIGLDNFVVKGAGINTAIVGFNNSTSNINETNSTINVLIPVTLSNYQSSNVDLSVAVTGGDAEQGDYTLNTSNLSFSANGTQDISIDINDDADFDNESIELTITETSSTGASILNAVHTLTIFDDEQAPAPPLVINEIFPDPTPGIDANGDGVVNFDDDEFIEIVNTTINPINIGGYTISDNTAVRFTFPENTMLPGGWAATVFGGGTPTNIPGLTFVATSLGLANAGDMVILDDGSSSRTVIDMHTYTSSTDAVSLARSPDFTGTFVDHTSIASNPVAISPGRSNTSNAALPVELKSFLAQLIENSKNVKLNWTTLSETSNDYFEIIKVNGLERKVIARVDGAGDSANQLEYESYDRDVQNGTNYYILRQFDLNGNMSYLGKVAVNVRLNETKIYPSLTHSVLNVELSKEATLTIYNVSGSIVMSKFMDNDGEINVSDLANGAYTLQINTDGVVENHRFIKQ